MDPLEHMWLVVRDAAVERLEDELACSFTDALGDAIGQCESPIEQKFLAGLWAESIRQGIWLQIYFAGADQWCDADAECKADRLRVTPQWKRGKCRHDFHIEFGDHAGFDGDVPTYRTQSLVVECDGHHFHERTKAQARKDRSRDRAAIADGLTVLRFTGSEIHKDPAKCAAECIAILRTRQIGREPSRV